MEYPQITSAQTSWWMGGGWVNSFSLMMEEHNTGLNINFLCRVLVDICVPTCVSNGLRRLLCIVTLLVFQVFTDGTKTLYQRRRPPVSFFPPPAGEHHNWWDMSHVGRVRHGTPIHTGLYHFPIFLVAACYSEVFRNPIWDRFQQLAVLMFWEICKRTKATARWSR